MACEERHFRVGEGTLIIAFLTKEKSKSPFKNLSVFKVTREMMKNYLLYDCEMMILKFGKILLRIVIIVDIQNQMM
jgi:hypothetical protein